MEISSIRLFGLPWKGLLYNIYRIIVMEEARGRGKSLAARSMLESLISTAASPQHSCTKRSSILDSYIPSTALFSESPIRKPQVRRAFCSSRRFLSPSDKHLIPVKKSVMRLVVLAKHATRRSRPVSHSGLGHWRPKQSPPAHPERLLRLSDFRGYQSLHPLPSPCLNPAFY